MKKHLLTYAVVAGAAIAGLIAGNQHRAVASDHDDGQSDVKPQSVNLTDLYAFREVDQDGAISALPTNLVLVMNCNPRSLPQTQYYFNSNARYEFHVTAAGAGAAAPTGQDDFTLRFEFGAPDATTKAQPMTVTALRSAGASSVDSKTVQTDGTTPIATTPFSGAAAATPVTLAGTPIKVFAGTRQDTFFFDVEQFFKVRKAAETRYVQGLNGGTVTAPAVGFNSAATANDFTAGYNVLTIAATVPMAFLRPASDTTSTVFDVWETASVKM